MRDRKKPKGTKARVQAHKKRLTYIGHAILIAILVTIIGVSGFFLYTMLHSPSEQTPINPTLQFKPDNPTSQLKAAIVDQLSLTYPNQTFIQTATNTLKQAGYSIDYYQGEQVTVEFYRNLPTHNYDIIILRVHSSATALQEEEYTETPVCLFTSEGYTKTKYIWEQLTEQVVKVSYIMPDPPYYFAITPEFVILSMKGRFQNTIIIMMGCEGLNNVKMAEAFIEKGAKVYIGWKGSVSASHTDLGITHLLQHFLIEKRILKEAVREVFKVVAFLAPTYNSLLIYYPLEAGDQTIENITG